MEPVPSALFAVGDLTGATPEFGKIKVCVTGNVSATFDFGETLVGGGGPGGIAADGTEIQPGECQVVGEDTGGSGIGRYISVTENPADYLVGDPSCMRIDDPGAVVSPCPVAFPNGGERFLNSFHGFTVTFDQYMPPPPPPPPSCTYTQGYWKTHAGTKKQPDAWPTGTEGGFTLGTVAYTKAELLSIMNAPTRGNGLVSLGTQLIAAKLNVWPGTTDDIDAADALIGGLVIPPVGGDYLPTSETDGLNKALTDYNEGVTGPGHCD
jgi:hypothetical protein